MFNFIKAHEISLIQLLKKFRLTQYQQPKSKFNLVRKFYFDDEIERSFISKDKNNSITTNKSIKNYKDNLWIIQQNVEIIRNKENILNKSILYSYITETIYTLYLTLIIDKNPLILIDEKISITNELKNILQKNTSINCKWKVSSFFKRELILLSFHIQIKIFNIYAQIKKLN